MLVLTRRPDQGDKSTLVIGPGIEITVVSTRAGSVRLGVTAPRDVPVHRAEMYEEIAGEIEEINAAPPQ